MAKAPEKPKPIKALVSEPIAEVAQVTTPKPTTPQEAPKQATGNVEQIVRQAARKYGVDENFMVRIATCESTMGQNLRNPSPVIIRGVNYGHAEGVFQFIPSTWERMSNQAGYGGRSVYDTEANINTAAWAFSTGHRGEWQC